MAIEKIFIDFLILYFIYQEIFFLFESDNQLGWTMTSSGQQSWVRSKTSNWLRWLSAHLSQNIKLARSAFNASLDNESESHTFRNSLQTMRMQKHQTGSAALSFQCLLGHCSGVSKTPEPTEQLANTGKAKMFTTWRNFHLPHNISMSIKTGR